MASNSAQTANPPVGRGDILLLAAASICALAAANLMFDAPAVLALAVLTALVLVMVPGGPVHRWAVSAAALGSAAVLWVYPPTGDVIATAWLWPAICLGMAAALAVASVPWLPRGPAAIVALVLLAASFAVTILGGRPVIDVWIILRDAANGLLAGQNPYAMTFPDVPPGQTDSCFNYLPATFLVTAPGQWLFGDVRWIEAALLFGTVALLVNEAVRQKQAPDVGRLGAALLLGVLPATLRVVQQSWNEPILLAGLVIGAVLIARDRPNWAILPIAIALASKQHVAVLLPLLALTTGFRWTRTLAVAAVAAAICAGWLLADPARFYACTVAFYTDAPYLARSVSAWQVVPEAARLPALLAVVVLAYALMLWRVPRTPAGFLIGSGTVLLAFGLMNKQTFLNQWVFAAELIVAGLALQGPAEGARPQALRGAP